MVWINKGEDVGEHQRKQDINPPEEEFVDENERKPGLLYSSRTIHDNVLSVHGDPCAIFDFLKFHSFQYARAS